MTSTLTYVQATETILVGEYERGLLEALLDRDVPGALTLLQARVLVAEAERALQTFENPLFARLADALLDHIRAVIPAA